MAADAPDVRTLEVRGWLLRASEDLRAGRHDLTAVPPLLNDVAFHSQQCAEKAMKAILVHREQAFRKTHNLTELGGAVARLEPSLAELMRTASLMTEFAWRFRYPGDQATVSHADVDFLVELTEQGDLFDLAGIKRLLEQELGRPVDVVPIGGLKGDVRERILGEVHYAA